jgi:hypothetical protein
MKNLGPIRALFVLSALYDGVLGLIFLFAAPQIFTHFNVSPPNHASYVTFPALLLIIFALMFSAIAANPRTNRNLIPYGILLKLSYCGTVFYYWLTGGVPGMWKPFAFIDLAFVAVFAWAMTAIPPRGSGK